MAGGSIDGNLGDGDMKDLFLILYLSTPIVIPLLLAFAGASERRTAYMAIMARRGLIAAGCSIVPTALIVLFFDALAR